MRKLIAAAALTMMVSACSGEENFTSPSQREAKRRAATAASRNATQELHRGMALDYTGDIDTDFIIAMIPQHQSAIDMARAQLAHGQDPEARKLAKKIVDTQTGELAQMRTWLAKRQSSDAATKTQSQVAR